MTINSTFSPILILLVFILYGWVHSLTASLQMKAWARKTFGDFADRYYRIVYIIFALISFVPVLAFVYLLPDKPLYKLPAPWSMIFNFARLLSLALLFLSVIHTGLMQFLGLSQARGENKEDILKTTGLYKFMRHPIYTFTITFFWFSPVMSQNSAMFYLAISLYSVIGAIYEERKLVIEFGQAYRDYRAKTPMLIPFIFRKK